MMIKFNTPPVVGTEERFIANAISNGKLCGDGVYGLQCQAWFERKTGANKALLTPNCTQALEMAAVLLDIQPGDEVIVPSYTFVSTANAFVLRGARVVFVDVRPDTMNIDETLIEDAISEKTKAIVVVHYAGVSCEMDAIMEIANRKGLFVVEDAAQAVMSTYKGRPLGSIGHLAAFSFHETKNYTSGGEGGVLVINDDRFTERAEIIREKGTDRSRFFRGMVDKYSWVDLGSSYLPSELQAAYLMAQLEAADEINNDRLDTWNLYKNHLSSIEDIELPVVPEYCEHNAHMFFIKVLDLETRTRLIKFLADCDIQAAFHYVPLHSSIAGKNFGIFCGEDRYTTADSERLLRLPLYYKMESGDVIRVIEAVKRFFKK